MKRAKDDESMKTSRKRGYRIFSRTAKITAQRVDEPAGWQLTSPKGTDFVSDDLVEQLAALPPLSNRAGMTSQGLRPAYVLASVILPAIEAAKAKLAPSAAGMNDLPMTDEEKARPMVATLQGSPKHTDDILANPASFTALASVASVQLPRWRRLPESWREDMAAALIPKFVTLDNTSRAPGGE